MKEFLLWLFNITHYHIWIDFKTGRVHVFKVKRNYKSLHIVTVMHNGRAVLPEEIHERITKTTYFYEAPTNSIESGSPITVDNGSS